MFLTSLFPCSFSLQSSVFIASSTLSFFLFPFLLSSHSLSSSACLFLFPSLSARYLKKIYICTFLTGLFFANSCFKRTHFVIFKRVSKGQERKYLYLAEIKILGWLWAAMKSSFDLRCSLYEVSRRRLLNGEIEGMLDSALTLTFILTLTLALTLTFTFTLSFTLNHTCTLTHPLISLMLSHM